MTVDVCSRKRFGGTTAELGRYVTDIINNVDISAN